jgi:hypothetical protein
METIAGGKTPGLCLVEALPAEVVALGISICDTTRDGSRIVGNPSLIGLWKGCSSFVQDLERIDRNECGFPDGCDYPPANFVLATGRANAFVGPCPLLAITLP